ncbi:MAG: CBS domain-containing protein [Planctomycetota bacterium]
MTSEPDNSADNPSPSEPRTVTVDRDAPIAPILTQPIVTVGLDATLESVRALFKQHRFHHLIVVEKGKAVGVLSERDLLKHISPFIDQMSERSQDTWTLRKRVHQIMQRDLVWASPDTTIHDACLMMAANRISCLPVLNDQSKPMGIITARDVLRWLADQLDPEAGAGIFKSNAA